MAAQWMKMMPRDDMYRDVLNSVIEMFLGTICSFDLKLLDNRSHPEIRGCTMHVCCSVHASGAVPPDRWATRGAQVAIGCF
jgi:hypothetical protein